MTDTLPAPRTGAPALLSVVYSSVATRPFRDIALAELLAGSRLRNDQRGLTGLLLHRDGRFMQVLEGPEPAVRRALAAIGADRRHEAIAMLDEERIEERRFGSWSMAYRSMTDHEASTWFGADADLPAAPTRAADLLEAFRQG